MTMIPLHAIPAEPTSGPAPDPESPPEPLLNITGLARYVGVSVVVARRYVKSGDLPPPLIIGNRATGGRAQVHRWDRQDVDAWLKGAGPRA